MRRRALLLAACVLAACGGRAAAPAPGPNPPPTTASTTAEAAPDAGATPSFELAAPELGVEGDEAHVRIDRCDETHGPSLHSVRMRRGIGRCYLDAGLDGQDLEIFVTVEANGDLPTVDVTGGPDELRACVDMRVTDYIVGTGEYGHAGCAIHLASAP